MKRFIVNDTFTSEDTGMEYYQGAIYTVDDRVRPLLEQWVAEGKVRDADPEPDEDDDDLDETIEDMKAKHEEDDDKDDA